MKKKAFIALLLLTLTVFAAACGKPTGDGGASGASAPTGNNGGNLTVRLDGMSAWIGMEIDDRTLSPLGEAVDVMKAQSCHYDGEDKIYVYNSYSLYTYMNGGKEILYLIDIHGTDITAPHGGRVGMTENEIKALYGSDFTAAGEAMRYDIGDGVELIIHLDGSTVNGIELCEACLD